MQGVCWDLVRFSGAALGPMQGVCWDLVGFSGAALGLCRVCVVGTLLGLVELH